jgi:hypothetical protein
MMVFDVAAEAEALQARRLDCPASPSGIADGQ